MLLSEKFRSGIKSGRCSLMTPGIAEELYKACLKLRRCRCSPLYIDIPMINKEMLYVLYKNTMLNMFLSVPECTMVRCLKRICIKYMVLTTFELG